VTPVRWVEIYWQFGRRYCLPMQDGSVSCAACIAALLVFVQFVGFRGQWCERRSQIIGPP